MCVSRVSVRLFPVNPNSVTNATTSGCVTFRPPPVQRLVSRQGIHAVPERPTAKAANHHQQKTSATFWTWWGGNMVNNGFVIAYLLGSHSFAVPVSARAGKFKSGSAWTHGLGVRNVRHKAPVSGRGAPQRYATEGVRQSENGYALVRQHAPNSRRQPRIVERVVCQTGVANVVSEVNEGSAACRVTPTPCYWC